MYLASGTASLIVWCIVPYGDHPSPSLFQARYSSAINVQLLIALIMLVLASALIFSSSVGKRVIACNSGMGVVLKAPRMVLMYSLYAVLRGLRMRLFSGCISAARKGV